MLKSVQLTLRKAGKRKQKIANKNKVAYLNPHIAIITWNINDLNTPIKRQSLAERIKKYDPSIWCLQETDFKYNDTGGLKIKWWENTYDTNTNQKKAWVALLILDKVDRVGHYMIIKEESTREIIAILNLCAPNYRAARCMKQKPVEPMELN